MQELTGKHPTQHCQMRYAVKGVISSRAPASVSSRPIAARAASTLGPESGRTALRAQSRNFASNWASVSGFSGEPIGSG